jgi:hypothetical protein
MEQDNSKITQTISDRQIYENLEAPCHTRIIPLWLVLLDNVPTLLLFIFGFLLINQISTFGAIIYGVYTLFSVVWFWARICPYCHHYNSFACPCGYGAISPRFFRKRDSKSFKKVFKLNILIVFPNWFVPLGIATFLLLTHFTKVVLIQTIIFSVIGFLIIPLISKLVGCKNCDIKDDCPWMTINKKA